MVVVDTAGKLQNGSSCLVW